MLTFDLAYFTIMESLWVHTTTTILLYQAIILLYQATILLPGNHPPTRQPSSYQATILIPGNHVRFVKHVCIVFRVHMCMCIVLFVHLAAVMF